MLSIGPLPHPQIRLRWRAGPLALAGMVAAVCGWACCMPGCSRALAQPPSSLGPVELDVKSEYSHIRVRRNGSIRTLVFVRDNGVEPIESQIDLRRPYDLLVPYSRTMFASYLFQPHPKRVLIVGLGGGGMVHFLRHYDPEVHIDAVEIDPVVVKIAHDYFAIRPDEHLKVITADGYDYLQKAETRYDVIFLDAFLKPTAETDETGLPLRLKTLRFYQTVQQKLRPGGVVAFNLNQHPQLREDIETVKQAFAQAYAFRVGFNNVVVVGSPASERLSKTELRTRAAQLDRRLKTRTLFRHMPGILMP